MHVLYRLPMPAAKAIQLEALRKDDVVSRQSVEVRDAAALGLSGGGSIVLIEGTEAGVARAEAVLKDSGARLTGPEADAAYARFRSQDEDAASGMGLVFGD
ncbi:MAG TPA: hypothetical protein VJ326_08795 [Thermoplasmata archaeon]|nr:hypothetical protein [Thermoplasmata archaeon]